MLQESSSVLLLVGYKLTTVSIHMSPYIRHPHPSVFGKSPICSGRALCIQYSYNLLSIALRECLVLSPCSPQPHRVPTLYLIELFLKSHVAWARRAHSVPICVPSRIVCRAYSPCGGTLTSPRCQTRFERQGARYLEGSEGTWGGRGLHLRYLGARGFS